MITTDNITGLQHLGLPVSNLEASKKFYGTLGFVEKHGKIINHEGQTIRVSFMEKGGFTIEMYQMEEEGLREIRSRQDGHIDHVALNVGDIDLILREVRALGIPVLEEDAPVMLPFWERGVRFFAVRGPDGEKVEFNQYL